MTGYSARGSVVVNGILKEAKSGFGEGGGCITLTNAKRNVIKSLANKIRSELNGRENWVNWPHLPSAEKNNWLDRVADSLCWIDLNGHSVVLSEVTSGNFLNQMSRAVA